MPRWIQFVSLGLVCAVMAALTVAGCGRSRSRVDLDSETQMPRLDVEALTEALSDPDPAVRFAAALDLAREGEKAAPAVAALTKLLSDRDENVRSTAAVTLGRIGPEAAP